jgi:hypothetical protein
MVGIARARAKRMRSISRVLVFVVVLGASIAACKKKVKEDQPANGSGNVDSKIGDSQGSEPAS